MADEETIVIDLPLSTTTIGQLLRLIDLRWPGAVLVDGPTGRRPCVAAVRINCDAEPDPGLAALLGIDDQ